MRGRRAYSRPGPARRARRGGRRAGSSLLAGDDVDVDVAAAADQRVEQRAAKPSRQRRRVGLPTTIRVTLWAAGVGQHLVGRRSCPLSVTVSAAELLGELADSATTLSPVALRRRLPGVST